MYSKIIDAHCLVGTDYWLSVNKTELAHQNFLDEYGMQMAQNAAWYRAVTMPFPSCRDGDYIEENDLVLKLHEMHDWTIPVLAFNYLSELNFRYLCEKLETKEISGVVLWPILCNMDLRQAAENANFRYLAEHYNCSFTVHVGAGNEQEIKRVKKLNQYCPEDAVYLAKAFPKNKFNLSHLLRISQSALEAVQHLDNVIVDISGISTHNRWFEEGKNVFPAEDCGELGKATSSEVLNILMNQPNLKHKLVFGSQYPFGKWYGYGLEEELEMIRQANLSEEQQACLMYKNYGEFMEK